MRDGVGGLEARQANGAVTGLVNGSAMGAASRAAHRSAAADPHGTASEPSAAPANRTAIETTPGATPGAASEAALGSMPDAAHWYGAAMRQRLAAFARRFVGDAWAAEDIAQETLVRAGRGLAALRRTDRAEAWLFRICRHAAIDHVRSRRVRRGVWAPMPTDGEDWAVPAAPQTEVHPAEESGHGAGSSRPLVDLRALPAHHRLLMSLYYERNWSQATICRMTGLSPSALRVRLFRARGALASSGACVSR